MFLVSNPAQYAKRFENNWKVTYKTQVEPGILLNQPTTHLYTIVRSKKPFVGNSNATEHIQSGMFQNVVHRAAYWKFLKNFPFFQSCRDFEFLLKLLGFYRCRSTPILSNSSNMMLYIQFGLVFTGNHISTHSERCSNNTAQHDTSKNPKQRRLRKQQLESKKTRKRRCF